MKGETMKPVWFHIRRPDPDHPTNPKQGAVSNYVEEVDTNCFILGLARCVPGDQFSKKIGRAISKGRADRPFHLFAFEALRETTRRAPEAVQTWWFGPWNAVNSRMPDPEETDPEKSV